jgi:hypothetical protein
MNQQELDALETQKYAELAIPEWEREVTVQDIAEKEKWEDYYREARLGII